MEEEMDQEEEEQMQTIPLDLELFALEEWILLNKRYNHAFFIFCSTELKAVSSICDKFKKLNGLI